MGAIWGNLVGQKFGKLTVVERAPDIIYKSKSGRIIKSRNWKCICDCQLNKPEEEREYCYATTTALRKGHKKSCGCIHREQLIKRNKHENNFDLDGEYGIGYDSNGKKFYFDLEDYDLISQYCWHVSKDGSVKSKDKISGKNISMHRLVMGVNDPAIIVDHKKHVRHDNRKSELRVVTKSQNNMNRTPNKYVNKSGCPGVTWSRELQKWKAEIKVNYKVIRLGWYEKYEDAVKARKEAEKKYFGEYSYDASMGVGTLK